MHILSPVTDNCSSWISGRGRMAVEMFSWPSLHERMCRMWGSNSGPLACQAYMLPIKLPHPAKFKLFVFINYFLCVTLSKKVVCLSVYPDSLRLGFLQESIPAQRPHLKASLVEFQIIFFLTMFLLLTNVIKIQSNKETYLLLKSTMFSFLWHCNFLRSFIYINYCFHCLNRSISFYLEIIRRIV